MELRTVDDIYASIQFTSDTIATRFIRELNRLLDIYGKVTISMLCDKAEIEITEDERLIFDELFWTVRIIDSAVYPIHHDGQFIGYGIQFPQV